METNAIICKYKCLAKLSPHFVSKIKVIYVQSEFKAFIVTKEDSVYSVEPFSGPIKVSELCDKEIVKFDSGGDHYVALNRGGKLFVCGNNAFGQLGIDGQIACKNWILNSYLSDKYNVIDVRCGYGHTVVLTSDRHVLAFGDNINGQIGRKTRFAEQFAPIRVSALNSAQVIDIACGDGHTLALTSNNQLLAWGWNRFGQLGVGRKVKQSAPMRVLVSDSVVISKICCGRCVSLLLTRDGDIYGFGNNQSHQLTNESKDNQYFTPIQINKCAKFKDIGASISSDLCVGLSVDNKCYMWGKTKDEIVSEMREINSSSIADTFATYEQMSHKSITMANSVKLVGRHRKYKCDFREIRLINCGAFGTVFHVKCNAANKSYAVKKIAVREENVNVVTKELTYLANLDNNYIVKYYDSWIETNYYIESGETDGLAKPNAECEISSANKLFSPYSPFLVHIQMELCSFTLKHAITQLKQLDNLLAINSLNQIKHYIAGELFVQILECVAYLHKQNPPIIHRDLKPNNILLNAGDGRLVKLADFGLSTQHEFDDQTHTARQGTPRYTADEVLAGEKYDTKADMYSLGVIMRELFAIDVNDFDFEPSPDYKDIPDKSFFNKILTIVKTKPVSRHELKYQNSVKLVSKLLSVSPKNRPDCEEILRDKHFWALNIDELESNENIHEIKRSLSEMNEKSDNVYFALINKINL